ncbi:hypothetical protein A5731_00305 [Mycolicibacterium conceptionense]|uniref:hypothetical protein n=1 Tax=Mycolicibacterium TaxID=1866885 RepID=UPI0007EAA6AB|nr:hypothetical protein [Mycolicibacterium conceptionense]OBB15445.1 hypothetical protein A5718_29695 [Mycolicibacterium conceptionense]OBF09187.1 hypothetical protein A5731_00305 [Mycolicibacterium conceptionense]
MLRTAVAAIAAVCTITLIGAPAANAEPAKGTTTRSAHENAPNNVTVATPKARKGAHKAGHPVEDYRIARKRTMDRYFDSIRDERTQKIRAWLDSLHH